MAILVSLGAAAPAQEARPAFLVFFDWGKAEIRQDWTPVLDEAVAAWRQRSGTRLLLSGHSDRSGAPAANRLAAKRRAEAVRDYLIARGVPAAAIDVAVIGEAQPIVPTEDGVREAQNRRVEVTVREP